MKSKILKALRSLHQNSISALTSRPVFTRGLDYFSNGRVIAFTWSKSDSELVSLIRGSSKTYQIKIRYTDDDLEYVCNCPAWDAYDYCKHVVCTLLTASNILNDQPIPGFAAATLKMQLLGNSERDTQMSEKPTRHDKAVLTLHLMPPGEMVGLMLPRCSISLFHGKKELPEDSPMTPPWCVSLLHKDMEPGKREKLLREALIDQHITIPLIVHTPHEHMQVSFNGSDFADAVTELDMVDKSIMVKCLALVQGNEEPLQEIVRIGERLIVDTVHKKIIILNAGDHWRWAYRFMYGGYHTSRTFPIMSTPVMLPLSVFNRDHTLNDDSAVQRKQFILKKDGKRVTLVRHQPTLVIDGSLDPEKQIVYLAPRTFIGEHEVPLDAPLNDYLMRIHSELPNWLNTKKRRPIITKALFALVGMHDPDHIKKHIHTIKEALCESYHGAQTGPEITHYFERFCELFLHKNKNQIVATPDGFYRVEFDHHYLWRPYNILSAIYGDFYSNEDMPAPVFSVPSALFFDSFSLLEKAAADSNIEVRLNNKKVKTVAMEVHVDASRSKNTDWFDIAPEILAHGISLTKEQRDLLFTGNGIIEADDCVHLLDAHTREIITLLMKIFMPQGSSSGKTKQEVAELPRLRVLDLLELRKSGAQVTLPAQDELLLELLDNFSKIEKIPLPQKFTGELREYQVIGYRWLAFLYKHRFGGCLADDMGLGKTVQAIAFLGGIAEGIIEPHDNIQVPHLIVVPPTLVFNWQHELQTFYPALRVTLYMGAGRERSFDACDIVLTTYDTVRIDILHLSKLRFHVIILDEAQAIKNIQSARTAAVRKLRGTFTLSLTGTPLENHIGEYYSILDVALPGLLPSYKHFMSLAQKDEHDSLIKKMNVFVLRRTKDAILKDLPAKVESNIVLEMTSKQQKIYATMVTEVKRTIERAYAAKTGAQANIIALTAILRLRQICISPQLIDAKSVSDAPKIDYLVDALLELVQEGRAALVFSQFIGCLDLIEKALKVADLDFYRIDGSTPMAQRKKIIESFQLNSDGISILLLSLKTGGVGLNLTRANYVFHIDPWWNPAVENQASDRAHRIGQRNQVFITRLVMHHTIEEKMMALKEAKQELFKNVMENAEHKKARLVSKKDFDMLLS